MNPDIRIREGWRLAPDRNRLLSAITVDGCDVHLEAIRVIEQGEETEDSDPEQRAADPDFQEELDARMFDNSCGRFTTATLSPEGVAGNYVIVACSYAD